MAVDLSWFYCHGRNDRWLWAGDHRLSCDARETFQTAELLVLHLGVCLFVFGGHTLEVTRDSELRNPSWWTRGSEELGVLGIKTSQHLLARQIPHPLFYLSSPVHLAYGVLPRFELSPS